MEGCRGEGSGAAGGQKEQKGRAESWELSVLTFAEKQRHDESKKGGEEGESDRLRQTESEG